MDLVRHQLAFVGLLAAASGCGGKQPFPGSASDLDALGRDVLEAFEQHDLEALESLRLSETEHNTVVWPELPAAQAPSPYPLDLAWQNIELRNRRAISRAAKALHAAGPLEFAGVECVGGTRQFDTFVVHSDCHTRFAARGRLYSIQLFKDVLERDGGFKIFRYYDEEPRLVKGP